MFIRSFVESRLLFQLCERLLSVCVCVCVCIVGMHPCYVCVLCVCVCVRAIYVTYIYSVRAQIESYTLVYDLYLA